MARGVEEPGEFAVAAPPIATKCLSVDGQGRVRLPLQATVPGRFDARRAGTAGLHRQAGRPGSQVLLGSDQAKLLIYMTLLA
jgi:hypothetical protein